MQAIEERIEALKAEVKALEDVVASMTGKNNKAADVPPSLLVKPGMTQDYWAVSGDGPCAFMTSANKRHNSDDARYINCFTSLKQAEAYADAFTTLLLLRHQPGTEATRDDYVQYVIVMDDKRNIVVDDFRCLENKIGRTTPCFSSMDLAQAAIDTIGAERILRMFRTFHHVEG